MQIQKLISILCFLGLLIVAHQQISLDDNDIGITVTHPSVFHEEYSDYRVTVQGSTDDHLYGPKDLPKPIESAEKPVSIFDIAAEYSTDGSESSDITDASDNDANRQAYLDIEQKMKSFEEIALKEIRKQKEFAKVHGEQLKQTSQPKTLEELKAMGLSPEEVRKLKNAKKEFEEEWKDFQTKSKKGEDVSEYLQF